MVPAPARPLCAHLTGRNPRLEPHRHCLRKNSTYEVLLSDMTFEEEEGMYYWECPCGDMFEISQEELDEGQDIAHWPQLAAPMLPRNSLEIDVAPHIT